MKRFLYVIGLALVVLTASCGKFLEETSQDELSPKTAQSLNELLLGEGYATERGPIQKDLNGYIDFLTDDTKSTFSNVTADINILLRYQGPFTWNSDMNESMPAMGVNSPNSWANYYEKIKGCNVVMDYMDKVTGTEAEKLNVKGQALTLRAFYYFMLVNLYGAPYNTLADPKQSLGVPLILKAEAKDQTRERNTVAEVYNQINSDLAEAIPYLEKYGTANSKYRLGDVAAHLLASRVALYQEDWDAAIKHCDYVIGKRPTLVQLRTVTPDPFSGEFAITEATASPEVIWAFGRSAEYNTITSLISGIKKSPYSASGELMNLYTVNDIRGSYYLRLYGSADYTFTETYSYTGKYQSSNPTGGKAFRVSEAYLNRAEARVMKAVKGDVSGIAQALADINTLRFNRIKAAGYTEINIADPVALLEFYKSERRRELCFEDHRWFDLRRWGRPRIEHTFANSTNGSAVYVLEKNDVGYTLPIPKETIARNPKLIQNPLKLN